MDKWKQKERPLCLERRFEFDCYEKTRDFLDRLGDYSEKKDRYPDISFGKTYVNITVRPLDDDSRELTDADQKFACEIDLLSE